MFQARIALVLFLVAAGCGGSSNPSSGGTAGSGGSGGQGGSAGKGGAGGTAGSVTGGTGGDAGSGASGGGTGGGAGATEDAASAGSGGSGMDAAEPGEAGTATETGVPADAPVSNGPAKIVLIAGGGTGGDGMPATMAKVLNPYGTVVDPIAGDIYISEVTIGRIRKIDDKGIISTIAGMGAKAPADVKFTQPHDLLFQPGTRILFIADTMARRIFRYNAETGELALFAGTGAQLAGDVNSNVFCLAFSPDGGKLYFSTIPDIHVIDLKTMAVTKIGYGNARVIAVDSKGTLYAVKNDKAAPLDSVNVASGAPTEMTGTKGIISGPKHIAVDHDDNVLIADTETGYIRRYIVAAHMLMTIVGNGTVGMGTLDGDPINAQVSRPHGIFEDAKRRIFISDSENNRVLQIGQ